MGSLRHLPRSNGVARAIDEGAHTIRVIGLPGDQDLQIV